MSFWDNNKGTFLAAGKATAKGIGTGTKALGKAGYRTYKNSQNEKKGLPPIETDKGDNDHYGTSSSLNSTNTGYNPGYNSGHNSGYNSGYNPSHNSGYNPSHNSGYNPGHNSGYNTGANTGTSQYQSQPKVDVNAFPLPPKRLVGPGEVRPLNSQAPQAQQSQQLQQPQQPQPQPLSGARPVPQPPSQAGIQPQYQPPQYQNGQIQQPAYGVDQQQQSFQPQPQQQQYQQPIQQPQPQPQQTQPQQQYQQHIYQPQPQLQVPYQPLSEQSNSSQPPPAYDDNNFQNNQLELAQLDSQPVAKKPLPDPSLFAPPPIHKNRGASESSDSASNKTDFKASPTGRYGNSTTSRNTSLNIDPSNIGPPPPKPYRENSGTTHNSSNIRLTPPLPTRQSSSTIQNSHASNVQSQATPIPAPPPSSNTASVNSESSQSSGTGSLLAPLPPRDNIALDSSKKKAPPPKPTKKPSHLSADGPLQSAGTDSLKQESKPNLPNFAEEIALRKSSNNDIASKSNSNSENLNLELKNKLRPVNSEGHIEPETSNDPPSLVKSKPKLAPKPKISLKPEISPKPAASSLPEKKAKPLMKPKPEIKAKPELKAKPIIGSKPMVDSSSKSSDMVSNPKTDIQTNKSSTSMPPIPRSGSAISNTPPPPIPRSQSATPNTSSSPPPPPPPSRNYRRTKVAMPPIVLGPPNFDLQLSTGWFANISGAMELPKDISGLNYNTSYLYTTHGSDKSYTRNINLRLRDLAVLSYAITWLNDNINNAKVEVTRFIPSPILNKIPTVDELIANQKKFGDYVASWSENKVDQKVGSGECWDLAHDALLKGCGNHAFISTYYHHGFPIVLLQGSENGVSYVNGKIALDELRRGDILQYTSCIFKDKSSGSVSTVGNPDHTSVILENMGDKLIIAEQNINNIKIVKKREICLGNLTQGTVVGYRPMPTEWAGNL
ncbi:uncharacterized protein AC631_05300 [Debaryomyces fabryi]|uniref:BBC1/AIM3 cysteine proteinase-fold domain-containing protein n=1 Tax=Debaryomyces fabryi TaxID=58627 RepID=A0A0V1PS88_9ASCO|nr:uncharacterized protein AC631_05300 [Debaryomyces fabryi]KRZ98939.1 hypothetical protein AC631_05300 [Debaryomyces fabryi]CUM45553.1 unnamed protein product [Debaryomyces fabryi]